MHVWTRLSMLETGTLPWEIAQFNAGQPDFDASGLAVG